MCRKNSLLLCCSLFLDFSILFCFCVFVHTLINPPLSKNILVQNEFMSVVEKLFRLARKFTRDRISHENGEYQLVFSMETHDQLQWPCFIYIFETCLTHFVQAVTFEVWGIFTRSPSIPLQAISQRLGGGEAFRGPSTSQPGLMLNIFCSTYFELRFKPIGKICPLFPQRNSFWKIFSNNISLCKASKR